VAGVASIQGAEGTGAIAIICDRPAQKNGFVRTKDARFENITESSYIQKAVPIESLIPIRYYGYALPPVNTT
jgi:hypothetical protein